MKIQVRNLDISKEKKSIREGINKGKFKYVYFFIFLDFINNCLRNNNNNALGDFSTWISEINNSDIIRNRKKNQSSSAVR